MKPGHWYDADFHGLRHSMPGVIKLPYLPPGCDGDGLVDACVPAQHRVQERVATVVTGAVVVIGLVAVLIASVVLAVAP